MEIWTIRNSPMTGMRAPKKVYILGKNSDHSSDNNWTLLKEDDFIAWTDANEPSTSPYRTVINGQVYHAGRNIIINSNNKYRYYRLVVNTIYGGNDNVDHHILILTKVLVVIIGAIPFFFQISEVLHF